MLVITIALISCKTKNVEDANRLPAPARSLAPTSTTFDAGTNNLCTEGRYIVPKLEGWVSEPLPTEDCLVRRLSHSNDEGHAILSICVPDAESASGTSSGALATQAVPLGPGRECRLSGQLSNKGGRVSGEIEIVFRLKNNGTDRLSVTVEKLNESHLYDLTFALVSASFAPFTKQDKKGFTWQYYSAECRRNRSAIITSSPSPTSVALRSALSQLHTEDLVPR